MSRHVCGQFPEPDDLLEWVDLKSGLRRAAFEVLKTNAHRVPLAE